MIVRSGRFFLNIFCMSGSTVAEAVADRPSACAEPVRTVAAPAALDSNVSGYCSRSSGIRDIAAGLSTPSAASAPP